MAGVKAGIVTVALAAFVSGCMGHRGWSYAEDGRIDGIIARGREPLEEAAARGVPVPHVPRSAESPSHAKAEPKKKTKSAKARPSSKAKAAGASSGKSTGFRFSGL